MPRCRSTSSPAAAISPPARSERHRRQITLGADKADDSADLVRALRERGVTPHVCQNTSHRRSAVDGRTTRHLGYAQSQNARRCGERVHGWTKTVALQRQTHQRGTERVSWIFTFALAVYDLVRMRTLVRSAACASRVPRCPEHAPSASRSAERTRRPERRFAQLNERLTFDHKGGSYGRSFRGLLGFIPWVCSRPVGLRPSVQRSAC